ncbi:YagK/YfjJ domain-containing protein [Arcobacter sp.]|uniref:YagK/YfjJ domain-containing protein n=1 Tax=Arcobacter sp. TaxID=1872629 RepID=UPI003D102A21
MLKNKIVKKRINSTVKYIDSLYENYSKLNFIREDFGYIKPHSNEKSIEDLNQDLNHLFRNRRTKPLIFKDNVGYIIKQEYTEDKGFHIHAIFIYDGQKVQKDVYKANQIGKYWENEITKGKGSYHNCNQNKYRNNGIGLIDYKDKVE